MDIYIQQIIEALFAVLALFIIRFANNAATKIKSEINNEKAEYYIDLINQTIEDAVIATNQTYVNSLKETGSFDESAQQFAFNQTKAAVMSVLTDSAQIYLTTVIKDLDTYINTKIEACVNEKKESNN